MINTIFKKRKGRIETILTHMLLIFIISFLVFPSVVMILTSLKKYEEVVCWPPKWFPDVIQWSNFSDVWSRSYNIKTGFINSLIVSSSTMIICIVLGSLAAYSLARFKFTGRKSFLFVMLATQMFSPVVFIIPMYEIMKSLHLLNTYACLILPNTAFSLPMTVWLLTGYFKSISTNLEEAAMVDGCSRVQAIFKVILPIAAPGIISAGIFAFIVAWNDLLFAMTFITRDEMRTLTLMLTDIGTAFEVYWHKKMAASVIGVLPVTLLFIAIQKHLVSGLTSGAVKE
ncbi:carbohydrate ABC transporter permease [Oceanirhabdus sp. W0125-5]|uniref:carbohydrate ABC transporter permease n=1 Tax=Oceanirhabdus sp. W0125-5 TaxID=2999116 RepID=UPI0022F2AD31|nr:carbohydrate ABC transporter permease [Oceanirhabdus sp. W0125-5]WBW96250.1 carbohydrate ABC transporter permease [Oceanirhabdus sp. W0125-5]